MKKIYSLIVMAAMASVAMAQSQVVLAYPADTEHANGATFTITGEVDDSDPDWIEVEMPSPSVVNKGSEKVNLQFEIDVKEMPANTQYQYCWGGNCQNAKELGIVSTLKGDLAAGESMITLCEWMPSYRGKAVYGSCTVQFTILVDGARGNSYTINYVLEESEGIHSATLGSKSSQAYDLQGRSLKNASASRGQLLIKGGKKFLAR